MTAAAHPNEALFSGEAPFPVLAACEHYAGTERQMRKALALQNELSAIFDLTCDCEDGAPVGQEREHARMIVEVLNSADNQFDRVGVRIHDVKHPAWREDLEIILGGAGNRVAYVTLPKLLSFGQARTCVETMQTIASGLGLARTPPLHALIETQGALHDVWQIAQLPGMETLDFGLLDFISGHHGAISSQAMRSPGQFEHKLIVRAKSEVAAAALANGLVPCHNVSLETSNTHNTYQDAWRARNEFGFLRMYSIHPDQIRSIVDAMKPRMAEVKRAAEILLAAREVEWGPIMHEGDMYDRAAYRYYWDVLRKAKACGQTLPPAAEAAFFG
ncbi:MAG TPA: aldolase/citrate lyase family protein [Burkholderiales bacterium]|nr:aldolase/citrate lyase family protein [Burkholderiales bacterium]